MPPRRYGGLSPPACPPTEPEGESTSSGCWALAKLGPAYPRKCYNEGEHHEGIALLESTARDHAARPDRGAPAAQAQEPRRLDGGKGPLASRATRESRREPGLDQEPRGPAPHSDDDPRRMDAGAARATAIRAAAGRARGGGDSLSPDLGDDRSHPAPGARQHEGLGVDRGDVVLWLLGFRRPPRRRRVLRLQLRHLRRLLGGALRERKNWVPRPAGRQHDDRGASKTNHDHEGDGRLLDADLRPPDGAGGNNDGRRSGRWAGQATHPLERAG